MTEHRVVYHHGGEVVCSCGDYFKTSQPLGIYMGGPGPVTGLEKWAGHLKESLGPPRQVVIRESLDVVHYIPEGSILVPPICLGIERGEPVALIGFAVTHHEDKVTCSGCLTLIGRRPH